MAGATSTGMKEHGLDLSIPNAKINEKEDGLLMLELSGKEGDLHNAPGCLTRTGAVVQPLKKDIARDESRCMQCGACVTVCPQQAFVVDPATRHVGFYADRCIACELCIKACPVRAIEAKFK